MTVRPRIVALFGAGVIFGQERGNIEALCALRDEGCEILCLVRDESWNTNIPAALDAVGLAWRKVGYIEQRLPNRMLWFLFRNPFAFIRGNWQFLEVVKGFRPTHVHAFNSLYVFNFILALTLFDGPMIYRAGDAPTLHNWPWRQIWRFVVWRTDRFVANSLYVANELILGGVAPDTIRLIYSVPPRRGAVAKFEPPQGLVVDDVRFAYIGQISPEKGVDMLIEAFVRVAAEAHNARLFVAGRISDWSGDSWARRLRARALSDVDMRDRIFFLGYVDDVAGLLDLCDVHVCPSVWDEPLANVVIEAKLAARPSIVFSSGGLPEVVAHDVDGHICDDKTVDSLATALKRYIDDPSVAQRQGKAARASLGRLGTSDFAHAWRAVYEELP